MERQRNFLNDSLFGILKGAEVGVVGGRDSGGRHNQCRIVNDRWSQQGEMQENAESLEYWMNFPRQLD